MKSITKQYRKGQAKSQNESNLLRMTTETIKKTLSNINSREREREIERER